jgi:transposase
VTRARVLLKSEAGLTDEEVVEALDVGLATVERVRKRFAERGLAAALDASPQPPRPRRRVLDGAAEARLVALACSAPPEGHGRWTLDLLADRMVRLRVVGAVSRDTVGRCLKKTRSSRG